MISDIVYRLRCKFSVTDCVRGHTLLFPQTSLFISAVPSAPSDFRVTPKREESSQGRKRD